MTTALYHGRTFGIEGLAPGTTILSLVLKDGDVEICRDEVRVTVVDLEVTWQDSSGNPIEAENPHPTAPIGFQWFPGAAAPGEGWQDVVRVHVQSNPPVAGLPVWLKAIDPDDPSADNNEVDSQPNAVGYDNRDHGTGLREGPDVVQQMQMQLDADGAAWTHFETAHQPGDNHRVAATLKQAAIDQLNDHNVPPSGQPGPPNPPTENQVGTFTGHISRLLTVWRRVAVEVDSMGAPGALNASTGTIPAAPTYSSADSTAIIPVQDLDDDFETEQQHLVGRLDIPGFPSFVTIDTVPAWGNDQVTIRNASPAIVGATGLQYVLRDDDAGSRDGFIMVGFDAPPVPLPRQPDTTMLPELFAPAYVLSQVAELQYYQGTTPFLRQVDSGSKDQVRAAVNLNRDRLSSDGFWTVHITSAFQGPRNKDGDPGSEDRLVFGVTDAWTFQGSAPVGGSAVYLETIRDWYVGNQASMAVLEQVTVGHEIGHQFYLKHEDGAGGYIMTDMASQSPLPPIQCFSPTSLRKIRTQPYPQGPEPNL